ncbi:DUF805 domain-containing protein [Staphylococcus arlettae]|uniref:DUF805 domain-containing protein n=2 Tax=Staphylococcus arlettae TaxID=29378 RepID=UPI0002821A91|nr:DUF805 domain-containing protein [Staphylococcus arlettae]EJY95413.1 hypothetical protein SARL_07863 [Staphylococcus arlettae CVD059]MDT3895442.1 DUF805 domain-containing protein [Staphylococcus arlettae]
MITQKISFGRAFKLFWRNYVNFTGRSRRSEYWYMIIWHLIFMVPAIVIGVISILLIIMGIVTEAEAMTAVGIVLLLLMIGYGLLYGIATFIPNLALQVRRFHDTDRTMFIPILASALGITFYIFVNTINLMDPNFENVSSWVLLSFMYITIQILAIYQIVICCFDSVSKNNKYGVYPKDMIKHEASVYHKDDY